MAILISSNHQPSNACYMAYFPTQGTSGGIVYLFSDDLSSWTAAGVGAGFYDASAWNSSCYIVGPGNTSTAPNSTTLSLTLDMEFFPSFVGPNYFDEYVADQLGGMVGLSTIPGTYTVIAPPIITTAPFLPLGVVSQSYSTQLQVQGSSPPYNWSLVAGSGSPPTGVTLSSNGVLSGIPTQAGNFSFTANVSDARGASGAPVTFTIPAITQSSMVTQVSGVSQMGTTSPTKVGIFRGTQVTGSTPHSFLEDSNGNGVYDAGVDRFILNFYAADDSRLGVYQQGDIPVAGDWTGDGNAKVGIYRPGTGQWFLDTNNDGVYDSGDAGPFGFGGLPGDLPVVGNWGNANKDCLGYSRLIGGNYGLWKLDTNCDYVEEMTDGSFGFGGIAGDVPVVGAWSTDRVTRVGMVRKYAPGGVPTGNPFLWVLDAAIPAAQCTNAKLTSPCQTGSNNCSCVHQPGYVFPYGGLAGDQFVAGDWYNTGTSFAGVFRSNHNQDGSPNGPNFLWAPDAVSPSTPLTQNCPQNFPLSCPDPTGQNCPCHVPKMSFAYGGAQGDAPLTGRWAPTMSTPVQVSKATGGNYVGYASLNWPSMVSTTITFGNCVEQPPVAACGSSGTAFSVSPSTATFNGSSPTFTVTAPGDAVPSAVNGSNQLAGGYQIPYTITSGGDTEQRFLPVYVPAPPFNNISINLNFGAFDAYTYNGYADRSKQALLTAPQGYPNCSVVYKTPRACMQNALSNLAQQNVTGLTLQFPICDSDFGESILTNCGGPGGTTIDQNWLPMFDNFLSDLVTYGHIDKLAFRATFQTEGQANISLQDQNPTKSGDPGYELLNNADLCCYKPSAAGSDCHNSKPTAPFQFAYEPAFPYALVRYYQYNPTTSSCSVVGNDSQPPYSDDYSDPSYYNDVNFVGWDNIFRSLNLVYTEMQKYSVVLDSVDLQNEVYVPNSPIVMRMFADPDPAHAYHSSALPSCPHYFGQINWVDQGQTLSQDVLGGFRCLADRPGWDPLVTTMSLTDARSTVDQVPAYDCLNGNDLSGLAGDPARVDDLSMFTTAMLGGRFGALARGNRVNGLPCGPANIPNSSLSAQLPQSYTLPSVIDMHAYICLSDDGSHGLPYGACLEDATDGLKARTEAIATFDDVITLETNRGWPSATRLVIGETHSPTSNTTGEVIGGFIPNPTGLPLTCEGAAISTPPAMLVGIRQSNANGTSGGTTVRPFNVSRDSCYDIPAKVKANGYDITQP